MTARSTDAFLHQLGVTLVRHTSSYAAARAAALALTFVQMIVLIQFLSPAAFGQFAIVTIVSSLVSLVCVLLFRRGTLNRTLARNAGDVDDDGDDDALDDDEDMGDGPLGASSRDPRAAFATGLILLTVTGAAIVALVVPLSGPVASLLGLPSGTGAGWLVIGVASGVLMAQWQTLIGVPYMLRRPLAYLLISLVRPALVLAFVVGLVAAVGDGAYEAVLGQFLGLAAAVVIALVAFRDAYRLTFRGSEVLPILVLSMRFLPRHLGKWAVINAPALVLASAASPATVGYYRLASRLTMPVEFPAAAFFQAWLPMQKSPIVLAADHDEGRAHVRAVATTLLTFVVCGLLVVFLAALDLLDEILPDAYQPSITLIPWLLGVAVADIVKHTARRFGRFPHRGPIYIWTLLTVAALTVPLSIVLIHALGAKGAALAGIAAWSTIAAVLWGCSQLGPSPIPLQYGRMTATVALAAACVGIAYGGRAMWPDLGPVLDIVAIALYPVGLVGLGILPREHRRSLSNLRREMFSRRVDDAVRVTVDRLEPVHRPALEAALAAPSANGSGVREESAQLSAMAALRWCGGTRRRPAGVELAIAHYLFAPAERLDRHHAVYHPYRLRVEPAVIELLERWREHARKAILG